MTTLIHNLGVAPSLSIHDVYSLDEPSLLAFLPRPALAVLLVFPVSAAYESHRLAEDALVTEYSGSGSAEPVLWFRQTIRNACGLMGLLHAVANGPAKEHIAEGSDLDSLLKEGDPARPLRARQASGEGLRRWLGPITAPPAKATHRRPTPRTTLTCIMSVS